MLCGWEGNCKSGVVSHWPCITDSVVYLHLSPGFMANVWELITPLTLLEARPLYLTSQCAGICMSNRYNCWEWFSSFFRPMLTPSDHALFYIVEGVGELCAATAWRCAAGLSEERASSSRARSSQHHGGHRQQARGMIQYISRFALKN